MASAGLNNPYTFQRASIMATRSLVSDAKPAEISSTSSHDVVGHGKQTLQRKTTDHYEQAAAAATKVSECRDAAANKESHHENAALS